MRKPNILVLLLLLILCTVAKGQELLETSNEEHSLATFMSQKDRFSATQAEDKYFLLLKFKEIPTGALLQQLQKQNIQLLSYHSDKTYLVAVPSNFLSSQLITLGIETVATPLPKNKYSLSLKNIDQSTFRYDSDETIDLAINFHKGTSDQMINEILKSFQIKEIALRDHRGTLVFGEIKKNNIESLSSHPVVAAMDVVQEADQLLNFEIRSLQGVNLIQRSNVGGLDLKGNGVTIGIGDGGSLGDHADLKSEINDQANGTYASFGAHGDHVAGIVKSSGAINPRHRGIAPNADIIVQKTSLITYYAEDYYKDYGMVLTNNSYGTTSNCDLNGLYNYSSQGLDKQLNNLPEVLHLFAAGNSGWETCGDYPKSYHTVLRYYQAAKNVLTVGNVKENRVINPNSSRGPVLDGRLKPEICGIGTSVMSTDRENGYWNASGTSMSSPAVAATIGLMYEHYRNKNGGANPTGALMKAIACNTAEDLGLIGPDFTYGYGLINAPNAIKVIDNNYFGSDQIENGQSKKHDLVIPNGVEKVKIMLYWHDVEADAATATKILVNDLDLKVVGPDNTSYLPWVLDPAPEKVKNIAVRKVDRLNNIEQVTIDVPAAGNYSIDISGFDVPFGPQEYFFTYEFIKSEIEVVFPIGGEGLTPNVNERVRWKAEESNTHKFKVEWSGDNGTTWNLIKNNIPATARVATWKTPATITERALVRVSKLSSNLSDVSDANFSIIASPENLAGTAICAGMIDLKWSPVEGAVAYDVMMLREEGMVSIGSTTDSTFMVEEDMVIGEKYWFSIRAKGPESTYSERAIATSCIPELLGSCDWENDANVYPMTEVLRGREKMNNSLTTAERISIEVDNIGANSLHGFKLSYSVNGEPAVSEYFSGSLNEGAKMVYTFKTPVDLSAPKDYLIDAWIDVPGDTRPENNYLTRPIEAIQLDHPKLNLPYFEGFDELSLDDSFNQSEIGPEGLGKWDLDLGQGSLAMVEKSDESFALTLGNTGEDKGLFENRAILNLELSELENTNEEVYFVFSYKSNDKIFTLNENLAKDQNTVFIRGSENDQWIKLLTLGKSSEWQNIQNVNITRVLKSEGQTYSGTSQIMFSQLGSIGLVLDNISLSPANRLPVALDTFMADKVGEYVRLKWRTLSESENDYFEIEMAEGADAVIRGDYRTIGKVNGQGFSSETVEYEFMDKESNKQGDRYYRLKQVDFNGTATETEFRVVSFSHASAELTFYPNPFKENITLSYESEVGQEAIIRIFDGKGQMIKEYQQQFQNGRQELPLAIDPNWPAGLYNLQVVFANQTIQSYRISKILD